jgi:uncharacterized glyoxalase superfamily protein PhnB
MRMEQSSSTTQRTTNQPISPFLYYEDVAHAIEWLERAFGFELRLRLDTPEGTAHAEMALDDGVVMLGNVCRRNASRPASVRAGVYVLVGDVDAHCGQARGAGAEILEEPADQPYGHRIYLARDHEGHEWYFAQRLRDVSIEELARQKS